MQEWRLEFRQQKQRRLVLPGREEVFVPAVVGLEDLEGRLHGGSQPLSSDLVLNGNFAVGVHAIEAYPETRGVSQPGGLLLDTPLYVLGERGVGAEISAEHGEIGGRAGHFVLLPKGQ